MSIRSASAALRPLDEAVSRLRSVAPVPVEAVPVLDAIGFTMADDVVAATGDPARRSARRDGWAVAAADVVGASAYAPVVLPSPPVRVVDGDPLPDGADTVLPQDAVDPDGDVVADLPAGEGANRIGQEIVRGDVLARRGERLAPLRALAVAAAGVATVPVRRPRIHLLRNAGAGSEALAACLSAWIVGRGIRVTSAETDRDATAIGHALRLAVADAVFVLGGTGFGGNDRSGAAVADAGTLETHGIALNPGSSAGFGTVAGKPVLLLPGRPEAALSAFLALGLPLLARLAGSNDPFPVRAPLSRKVSSTIGMSDIVFVRRSATGVDPLGGADLPLRRLILADGAMLVPPEREGYPEGALVEIMPL